MLLIALFLVVVNGLPISQLSTMGKTNIGDTCAEGEQWVDEHCCPTENILTPDSVGEEGKVEKAGVCCLYGALEKDGKCPPNPDNSCFEGKSWVDDHCCPTKNILTPDSVGEDGKLIKDGVCCQHGPLREDGQCPPEEMDETYGQIMDKGFGCPEGLAVESKDDCGTLARGMGLCDIFVGKKTSSKNYPVGCFYAPLDKSPCPSNGGNKLYWNSRTSSTYFTKEGSSGSYRNLCKPDPAVVAANSCPDKHQKITSGCCYETNILWDKDFKDGKCCEGAVASGASECPSPGSCGVWLDPAYSAPYYKDIHCPKKQNAKLCNAEDACEWWFDNTELNRKPDCDSYWLSESECLDKVSTNPDQKCHWDGQKCHNTVCESDWLPATETACLDKDSTDADQECYWGGNIEPGCHSTACLKDKEHHSDKVEIEGTHSTAGNSYRYDITIGSGITQTEISHGRQNEYNLGTKSSVVGNKEYYTGGTYCGGHGSRNSTVEYFFGGEEGKHGVLLSEKEYPTCVYSFQIQLPDCLICAAGEIEIHEEGKEHECCPVSRQTADKNGQNICMANACPPGEQPVYGECCGNHKIIWTGNVATECCAGDTVRTEEGCGTVAAAPAAPVFT